MPDHRRCYTAPGALALVLIASASAGCATSSYLLRASSPRVSIVMSGGSIALVRRGQQFPLGLFGSGLIDAVRGVPEAEHHAQAYRDGTTAGFVLTLVGGGAAILGVAIVPLSFAGGGSSLGASVLLPTLLVGGGLATELVGVFVSLAAAPHLYDAVNVFNDRVERDAAPPPFARGALTPWMRIGTPQNLAPPP